MTRQRGLLRWSVLAGSLASIALLSGTADAATFKLLHVFGKKIYGRVPMGGVIEDEAGNLYGTTDSYITIDGDHSYGTVYALAPDRSITVLHTFTGGDDGAFPIFGLVRDRSGNLYGSTSQGGAGNGSYGLGTVFKLAPDGTETVLHAFTGVSGSDGAGPGQLTIGRQGELYGTTSYGGTNCLSYGCGIVFKLAPDGAETILYAFKGGTDGQNPSTGLIADKAGNLYGATYAGGGGTGCSGDGCGTLYRIAPDGTETVLHAFASAMSDGYGPSSLIADKAGNFYGTTSYGGSSGNNGYGWGTIFEILPDGTEKILYAFRGGTDGQLPDSLAMDKAGNLYGTTSEGGMGCPLWDGCGTVFKFAHGTKTLLYDFTGQRDGWHPNGIVVDSEGNLVGTAPWGGKYKNGGSIGWGTVFELIP
jgi:uncharacterized repeat protein (TIGR03803 family)